MRKMNIHYYNSIQDLAYTINCVLDVDWFVIKQDKNLATYVYDSASGAASEQEAIFYESDYVRFIELIKNLIDCQVEDIDQYFEYV